MAIRGAPAIGVAGAFGLALTAAHSNADDRTQLVTEINSAAEFLRASRPTAVNLKWALERMLQVPVFNDNSKEELIKDLIIEAGTIAEEDIATNKRIAKIGSDLIQDDDVIIHHCNTGSLATVEGGTALGVIREAWDQGKRIRVLVDETRPLLQGARLTAWELEQEKIPYAIITDNAAGYFLQKNIATKVMFGADRVAANGDVVNKIGTYMLALAARESKVPVFAIFPSSSLDILSKDGDSVEIEMRNEAEVLGICVDGERATPKEAHALNPAFDITPSHLITAWITDTGIFHQPFNPQVFKKVGKIQGEQP